MWNWVIFCTCTPIHQDNKMIFNIWMIFFLRIKLIIMLHAYKTWKIFLKILIKFWNFYPGCYGHSRRGGTTTRRPPARRPCSRGTRHGALTLTCFIIILWHLTSKNSTLWKLCYHRVSYFLNLQMIVKDFVHLYINLCWTTVLWNKLVMYEKEKHCLWCGIGMFGSLQY